MPPPRSAEAVVAQVQAEAARIMQNYVGGDLTRVGRRVVEERLRAAFQDFGINIPADQMNEAAERVLREISAPPSPLRSHAMVETFARIYGTRPVDRRLDAVPQAELVDAGLYASIQAPLQVSQVTPRPLDYRTAAEAHMAQQIMAEEDQRIFDVLDRIAQEGSFEGPGFMDVSLVREPTDPHAHLRPGQVYVASEPEWVGRFPVRIERTVLPADPPRPPLGFTMEEQPGIGVVNPSAIRGRRVVMPEFEISSNPSISLEAVQRRRFDLIFRGERIQSAAVQAATSVWFAFLASRQAPPVELPTTPMEI